LSADLVIAVLALAIGCFQLGIWYREAHPRPPKVVNHGEDCEGCEYCQPDWPEE
jgi:hypothetical protein